jgi:hypothetical protein
MSFSDMAALLTFSFFLLIALMLTLSVLRVCVFIGKNPIISVLMCVIGFLLYAHIGEEVLLAFELLVSSSKAHIGLFLQQ